MGVSEAHLLQDDKPSAIGAILSKVCNGIAPMTKGV